jgi:hypothetical protein
MIMQLRLPCRWFYQTIFILLCATLGVAADVPRQHLSLEFVSGNSSAFHPVTARRLMYNALRK